MSKSRRNSNAYVSIDFGYNEDFGKLPDQVRPMTVDQARLFLGFMAEVEQAGSRATLKTALYDAAESYRTGRLTGDAAMALLSVGARRCRRLP